MNAATNDVQIIAAASMLLAGKVEYHFRSVSCVVILANEILQKMELANLSGTCDKDACDQLMKKLPAAERHLLATLSYDFDVDLPYVPLVAAVKKLEIKNWDVIQVAWNFVNDWCFTPMCLMYEPHYIAAAALVCAAKLQNFSLPEEGENAWWLHFDVLQDDLRGIIKFVGPCIESDKADTRLATPSEGAKSAEVNHGQAISLKSCIAASGHKDEDHAAGEGSENPLLSNSRQEPGKKVSFLDDQGSKSDSSNRLSSNGSEDSGENADETKKGNSNPVSCDAFARIDMEGIRGAIKRRTRNEKELEKKLETPAANVAPTANEAPRANETLNEAWIERELDEGIERESGREEKKPKVAMD